jgi:predicted enzyme related to lactoylglutathione lyase
VPDITHARISWIQIDAADPERQARFWAGLLDVAVDERMGESPAGPRYVVLKPQTATDVALAFQWVPEEKRVKDRVHLDVSTEGRVEEITELVERLGGARAPSGDFHEHGWKWRVMFDPEGNEFCLLPGEE